MEKVGDWNRFSERTGGTLVEKCRHFRDLMRLTLQSDPVRIYASAAADVNHQDELYDGRVPDIIDNAFVTGEMARVVAKVRGPARFSPGGLERAAEFEISDRSASTHRRRNRS